MKMNPVSFRLLNKAFEEVEEPAKVVPVGVGVALFVFISLFFWTNRSNIVLLTFSTRHSIKRTPLFLGCWSFRWS
jgi:hypothetical protein